MSHKKFFNHPLKEYHATFLRDYQKTIQLLELTPEFHSKNLSQISFHILYNCEFPGWSEELKKEVQKVKEYYLDRGIFAKVLHDPEDKREYIDIGNLNNYYINEYFREEDNPEDNQIDNISKSFDESKIYQINERKYHYIYYNLYYDHLTNEEEYYSYHEKKPFIRKEFGIFDKQVYRYKTKGTFSCHSSDNSYLSDEEESEEHTCYVPFKDLNEYYTREEENHIQYRLDELSTCSQFEIQGDYDASWQNKADYEKASFNDTNRFVSKKILSGREIKDAIEEIKSFSKFNRFKVYSTRVIAEDVKPFFKFVNLDNERTYLDEKTITNKHIIGLFVNKNNPDPEVQRKAREYGKLYLAYQLFRFNYNYSFNIAESLQYFYGRYPLKSYNNSNILVKNAITRALYRTYTAIDIANYLYRNKDLSFLNYSIDKNHHICQIHKDITNKSDAPDKKFFDKESNLNCKFRSKPCKYALNYLPSITIKILYNELSQEELSLLDEFPVQAAFIYKNYPYLQNTWIKNKNLDPFFNMLRILKMTKCNLNIVEF